MRLAALLVTAILTAGPALARQGQTAKPVGSTSPAKDVQPPDDQASNLPVSLDRIREALQQPAVEPLKALRGLDERPLFRVEIRERQRIEELLATLKFNSGPAVPGGLYGYEQQRIMFPSVDNPLAQPWSAFNQPELARVASLSLIETLLAKYLARQLFGAINSAEHASAQRAARDEVNRAIADYCAAQPNRGAGIQICSNDPIR